MLMSGKQGGEEEGGQFVYPDDRDVNWPLLESFGKM